MTSAWIAAANSCAESWARDMIRAALPCGALILFVWALCRLFPRIPPAWRCGFWWLAALKLVIGLVPLSMVSLSLPALPLPSIASYSLREAPPLSAYVPDRRVIESPNITGPVAATPPISANAPNAARVAKGAGFEAAVSVATQRPFHAAGRPPARLSVATLLLGFWLVGVLICAGTALRGYGRARSLLRGAGTALPERVAEEARQAVALAKLRRLPCVRMSSAATSPLTVGVLRPTVVLPRPAAEDLSASELRMALVHEFIHIRRGDPWLGLAPALALSLFWFYPLAWVACREFALCREEACDAQTLLATQSPASEYGRLILKFVALGRRTNVGMALGTSHCALHRRLSMLATTWYLPVRWTKFLLILLLASVIVGLLPWRLVARGASATPVATTAPPAPVSLSTAASSDPNAVRIETAETTMAPSAPLHNAAPSPPGSVADPAVARQEADPVSADPSQPATTEPATTDPTTAQPVPAKPTSWYWHTQSALPPPLTAEPVPTKPTSAQTSQPVRRASTPEARESARDRAQTEGEAALIAEWKSELQRQLTNAIRDQKTADARFARYEHLYHQGSVSKLDLDEADARKASLADQIVVLKKRLDLIQRLTGHAERTASGSNPMAKNQNDADQEKLLAERIDAAEAQVQAAKASSDLVQSRFAAGLVTIEESEAARADLEKAQADLEQAQAELNLFRSGASGDPRTQRPGEGYNLWDRAVLENRLKHLMIDKRSLTDELALVKKRYEAGVSTQEEVLKIQTKMAHVDVDIASVELQLSRLRAQEKPAAP